MKILIIEDEPPIAEEIREMTCEILGKDIERIDVLYTYFDAIDFLKLHTIDLCLLDLNLSGRNGFEILKNTVSGAFHTIIISAYTDQAIEAFNYGVLDFLPKPLDKKRLKTAIEKFTGISENKKTNLKYLVVRKKNANHIIQLPDIHYFEAEGYLVKIHLKEGKTEIMEKSLNRLMQILPEYYWRIHRSFIVDISEISYYRHKGGGVYEVVLKNNASLPLSPSVYKLLQNKADKK